MSDDAARATLDLTRLNRIAKAADHGGCGWMWRASEASGKGGYPQQVLRVGDVGLICDTYDEPDHPAITPEFIAAFDPPTVLELLRMARLGMRREMFEGYAPPVELPAETRKNVRGRIVDGDIL